jgi:tRNA pseudouridine32 synthase/23S rRNA pseudouridine746 synthase
VYTHVSTYPSVTAFATVWTDDVHTLLVVRPITGRRHQIRVHLAWIGHELAGDPLFGRIETDRRTLLHAWRLAFDAEWLDGRRLALHAPPDEDFWAPLGLLLPEVLLYEADQRLTELRERTGGLRPADDGSQSED